MARTFAVALQGLLALALSVALGGCAGMAAVAARVEPVQPCFVTPAPDAAIDAAVDCGYVVVPQNAAAPDWQQVKLGFVRLSARIATSAAPAQKKAAPLFMLAGGPGGSLIQPEIFDFFRPQFLGPILDQRDVVIVDQRGARHAVPVPEWPARMSRGRCPTPASRCLPTAPMCSWAPSTSVQDGSWSRS